VCVSQGDSGGPLFCLHPDGRFYLHGITSYGTEPCANGLPGIYTKVWVINKIEFSVLIGVGDRERGSPPTWNKLGQI